MSKLSFRARALDATKPMPIYMAEELPDLPDYSAINRAVPQMPSGMEKEEECEHHLQRAICAGLIIPTPEVTTISDVEAYDKLYPANYKQPRQLIHMQPFTMEQDIIDYDMDSDDERWLMSQTQRLDLTPLKFEEMMDKLEKSSGQTVVTLNEAKALLKEDDDLIIAVFDYWLNKRLKTQHPLIVHVRTEQRPGTAANNPYIAFRRRTEKMQTRKNRKNDESSYEKMLKLRRDLSRAVTLLELVKRREKIKREYAHLTVEVFEKRYQARDFTGAMVAELNALKASRPAFTQIFHNHYPNQSWSSKSILKDDSIPRKEKRQYKKRKHKSSNHRLGSGLEGFGLSSDDDLLPTASSEPEEVEDEGQFAFRRNKFCSYHMPQKTEGNWPWCSSEENGLADKRYRYTLTSLAHPRRCVGFARRRVGRGGRIILDRISTSLDNFWRTVDFTIYDSKEEVSAVDGVGGGSCVGTIKNEPLTHTNTNHLDVGERNSVKSEVRLRTSESTNDVIVKEEPIEPSTPAQTVTYTPEEQDEMVGFLEEVRRDWLHFRPKTPPLDAEACSLLSAEEETFTPSANAPFSLEIQTLEAPAELLDSSVFITPPFTFEDLVPVALEVPVTDTRQSGDLHVQTGINLNVNVGLDTLTTSSNISDRNISSNRGGDVTSSCGSSTKGKRATVGCSVFNVCNLNANVIDVERKIGHVPNATPSSPRVNNVQVAIDAKMRRGDATPTPANGLLSQFGYEGDKTKNNKRQSYAYKGGVGNSSGLSNALSICTSTHPLNTLNSHSANILEIPMTDDATSISHKVNSADTKPAAPNNKNKVIVQKSNLVMEVT